MTAATDQPLAQPAIPRRSWNHGRCAATEAFRVTADVHSEVFIADFPAYRCCGPAWRWAGDHGENVIHELSGTRPRLSSFIVDSGRIGPSAVIAPPSYEDPICPTATLASLQNR